MAGCSQCLWWERAKLAVLEDWQQRDTTDKWPLPHKGMCRNQRIRLGKMAPLMVELQFLELVSVR